MTDKPREGAMRVTDEMVATAHEYLSGWSCPIEDVREALEAALTVALRDAIDRLANQDHMLRVVGQHARWLEAKLDAMGARIETLGAIATRLETQAADFAKVGNETGDKLAEIYRAHAAELRDVCRPLEVADVLHKEPTV